MGGALRRIPLELQVALELYDWEGMAGPELAVVLELPEGTVRTRLRRGRQLMNAPPALAGGGRSGSAAKGRSPFSLTQPADNLR